MPVATTHPRRHPTRSASRRTVRPDDTPPDTRERDRIVESMSDVELAMYDRAGGALTPAQRRRVQAHATAALPEREVSTARPPRPDAAALRRVVEPPPGHGVRSWRHAWPAGAPAGSPAAKGSAL